MGKPLPRCNFGMLATIKAHHREGEAICFTSRTWRRGQPANFILRLNLNRDAAFVLTVQPAFLAWDWIKCAWKALNREKIQPRLVAQSGKKSNERQSVSYAKRWDLSAITLGEVLAKPNHKGTHQPKHHWRCFVIEIYVRGNNVIKELVDFRQPQVAFFLWKTDSTGTRPYRTTFVFHLALFNRPSGENLTNKCLVSSSPMASLRLLFC